MKFIVSILLVLKHNSFGKRNILEYFFYYPDKKVYSTPIAVVCAITVYLFKLQTNKDGPVANTT